MSATLKKSLQPTDQILQKSELTDRFGGAKNTSLTLFRGRSYLGDFFPNGGFWRDVQIATFSIWKLLLSLRLHLRRQSVRTPLNN